MNIVTKFNIVLERVLAARAMKGPYRFLVKNWSKFTTIDLATKVLNTEYFKDQIIPTELPIQNYQRVVVLAPHQDDGIIGVGGTMALWQQLKCSIDIVYLTDGGLPNWSDSMEALIEARDSEAEQVCKSLNATIHKLDISNYTPRADANHLKVLSGIIQKTKPQLVLIPWLLDSPPKHRWANHLLMLCHQYFNLPEFEIAGYQVHNTLLPNTYVDITEVSEKKLDLLRVFKSQNEYYKRYDHLAMGMNAWNSRFIPEPSRSPKPRYIEVFFTLPKKDYLQLVRKFYLMDLNKTYCNDQKIVSSIKDLTLELESLKN